MSWKRNGIIGASVLTLGGLGAKTWYDLDTQAELQEGLETQATDVADHQRRIVWAEQRLGTHDQAIGTLGARTATVEANVANLQADVNGACCRKDGTCAYGTTAEADCQRWAADPKEKDAGWRYVRGAKELAHKHESIWFDSCCAAPAADETYWDRRTCVRATPENTTQWVESNELYEEKFRRVGEAQAECTDKDRPEFRPGYIRLQGQVLRINTAIKNLDDLRKQVAGNQRKIWALEKKKVEDQAELDDLKKKLAEAQTALAGLTSQVNALASRPTEAFILTVRSDMVLQKGRVSAGSSGEPAGPTSVGQR
ncbi:MAG: hypothetical protein UY92_C0013G0036 [Candidatus Magasanikbacteria bacterium GW2011_GWA2_56_11]|uniref:Uncharacterized protein n=1 Tax=Candidatus Magasanikbacteria bacterium GW2011_GWA2_56_11 TaxID=1619044 RepID=A0A0G2AKQ4_9BACT|nr:MAG: hypothetical protein UY92_C0013G0036 [Candidatus Magasanikbacteria bacterium GW2011_GWA2_56_11]